MARIHLVLSVAVLLTATISPDHARADDRKIAQQIANVMKATGKLKDYDILVTYADGEARLQGTVANSQQMRTAIEITKAEIVSVDNNIIRGFHVENLMSEK